MPRWYLYCSGVFVHSTDDDDMADQWEQADPGGHVAATTPPPPLAAECPWGAE
jgi:hypothetical protein